MKKTILVTAFEPFNNDAVNPSWEIVRDLNNTIGNNRIVSLLLPVEYGNTASLAWAKAQQENADAILCVGYAASRKAITPEKVAINLRNGIIADNRGMRYLDEPIDPQAPSAYFTTLNAIKQVDLLLAHNISASLSYSAGAYVCNDLLFSLLHQASLLERDGGKSIKVGFVHLPPLPQTAKPNGFCLSHEEMITALQLILENV